ncbi:MAG: hypothetical protein Q8M08_14710 [Bacteroidales bacterium]|nr:hypothetical protein [Bacteroidales bacterium]
MKYSSLPESNKVFIFGILLAYIAVEITGIMFHPMWRDEIHFWSISGASSSMGDLLHRKGWDGHPDLWYILVYAVRGLSDNPLTMQLLHSGIAILSVFLMLKYAPFTRLQRIFLVFGYYYLFEYAIVSRNYAVEILLLTLILALYRHRSRFILLIPVLLFLLVQTNVFGMILCIALLLTWFFEFFYSGYFKTVMTVQKVKLVIGFILVFAGIVYSVQSVLPPAHTGTAGISDFSLSQLTLRELIRSVATVWKAWIPIPDLNFQFWNTNIVRSEVVQAILALVLMFSAGMLFLKRPVVLFLFIMGLIGIIAFIFIIFFGYLRHHGHLFILLITCLWLNAYYPESGFSLRSGFFEKLYGWFKKNAELLFSALLIVHILSGIYAFTVQVLIPFSAGKETAQYIRDQKLDRFLIAGDTDISLETVASYLDREVFYISRNTLATYMDYNPFQRSDPDESRVLSVADSLMKMKNDTILLVMNYPLKKIPGMNLKKIKSFEKSIVSNEVYYLYLLTPPEN